MVHWAQSRFLARFGSQSNSGLTCTLHSNHEWSGSDSSTLNPRISFSTKPQKKSIQHFKSKFTSPKHAAFATALLNSLRAHSRPRCHAFGIHSPDNLRAGLQGIGDLGDGSRCHWKASRAANGAIPGMLLIRLLAVIILIQFIPGRAAMLQSTAIALRQSHHESPFHEIKVAVNPRSIASFKHSRHFGENTVMISFVGTRILPMLSADSGDMVHVHSSSF